MLTIIHISKRYSISCMLAFCIHLDKIGDKRYNPSIMYIYQNCTLIVNGFIKPFTINIINCGIVQLGPIASIITTLIIAYKISQKTNGISIRFNRRGITEMGCTFLSNRYPDAIINKTIAYLN